jgi:hypothetical protein
VLLQRSRGSFNNNLPPCPLLEPQGVAIWSSTTEANGLRYNMQLCPDKNLYKKKDKTLFFIIKFTHIATSILQSFQSSKSLALEHLELYQTFFTKVCMYVCMYYYYYYLNDYYYYFVFMSAYKGCL